MVTPASLLSQTFSYAPYREGQSLPRLPRPVRPREFVTNNRHRCKSLLDIFPYRNIFLFMARAATTSDAFNAVAEPRRREILSFLVLGERPVGDIVTNLHLDQPSVSKHLRVLREVGLVRMRCNGRQKLYSTNADGLRPVHEWTSTFERYWTHQLHRIKDRAERAARNTGATTAE